jgi:microcystin-dependent protein
MRVLPLALGLFFAGFLMFVPGAHAAQPLGLPEGKAVLFAVEAEQGTLTRTAGSKDRYVLTLGGLPTQGIWFTDRPARQSGSVALGSFFSAWKGLGFRSDPPNAVVSVTGGSKRADAVTVELGKPRFDKRTRTVRFGVRMLQSLSAGLAHLGPRLDKALPKTFGDAALFIDDAAPADPTPCPITGEVDLLTETETPGGYLPANGGLFDTREYPTLNALFGTTFGSDGTDTFRMPDVTAPSGLQYALCAEGAWPVPSLGDYSGRSDCMMGQIALFAQSYAPVGWVPADGRALLSAQSWLDRIIGSTFGGDDVTSFNVPKIPDVDGLKAYICANGELWQPYQSRVQCTIGQVVLMAVPGALPGNLTVAKGQLLAISQNTALYDVIGTRYGGDGVRTFQLPTLEQPMPGTSFGFCLSGTYPQPT